MQDATDKQYEASLKKVTGLSDLVTSVFPKANAKEQFLWMELVLHGLAAHSLLSKKTVETETRFSDLLGTMMNFNTSNDRDVEEDEDSFNLKR
ncbi:hypothetical protein MKQ70_11660 [Chitinophaga sedimenti]|uniref:hypothetical protein n=1 Tax=Chitinophaga sedimenti TaxID=2033606 RepID=UPI0020046B42|nr:hypothetical protein [Chitinophaga sedimenti]MCK7555633.1 hypothetical protein [Chitinophaga sedimenti]